MCGIFGIFAREHSKPSAKRLEQMAGRLFKLSESRGREASGMALRTTNALYVLKAARPAHQLIASAVYRNFFTRSLSPDSGGHLAFIGHSRLVTNGSGENNANNQPVVKSGIAAVHNGIIVNGDEIRARLPELKRAYEVDTEIIPDLIRWHEHDAGSVEEAARLTFHDIAGEASIAILFDDRRQAVLATNTGSIFLSSNEKAGLVVFASEAYILHRFITGGESLSRKAWTAPSQLPPGQGLVMDLANLGQTRFSLDGAPFRSKEAPAATERVDIVDLSDADRQGASLPVVGRVTPPADISRACDDTLAAARALRRCTRCVLPETMPFIEFDSAGVCNYCRNHAPIRYLGPQALSRAVDPYHRPDGKPDCIVTFSGGRDSSYALHYLKTELRLNPIAYTYDWGMITDLARRNQARLCGKLGVEHVVVSADIRRKRRHIRENVAAWLRKPDLGTVPLFMAGDKQYFWYANRLRRQTGVNLIVIGTNLLERTDFKSGFCGVRPRAFSRQGGKPYALSMGGQLKMAFYYASRFIANPAFINASIPDTAFAYLSYYLVNHDFLNIYQYLPWDENTVNDTLKCEYKWERATDTSSTWRIGDGTAPFYNYIYLTGAGFTENDTFLSNQVREGLVTREAALKSVEEQNQPRWDSLKWYTDTLGLDFAGSLRAIHAMPRAYRVER
jgi:asparagine synthetase B (glutamine-hydrolysing)